MYVDDIFAVVPACCAQEVLQKTRWILGDLLRWMTDDQKSNAGNVNVILGAEVSVGRDKVSFSIPCTKKAVWL